MRKLILIFMALVGASFAATSLSQNTITWTFDADYTTGQYANGDYYVVAPSGLTITDISPASTLVSGRTMHGSMINPVARPFATQGFDSTLSAYSAALNVGRPGGNDIGVGNPLVVAAGSSLISSRTIATPNNRPQLSDCAVLTVVASAPAAGSFRPPYCGTDKTAYWNKSALNYSVLQSLAVTANAPSLATVESTISKVWLEIDTQYSGREFHPSNHMPIYGRDMAYTMNRALNSLHLNYSNAQKENTFIYAVQYGIDIYGAALTGGDWVANGGHDCGRKAPLVLAGVALNDANILAYADKAQHNIFQEDQQTFYVAPTDVGKKVADQLLYVSRLRLTATLNQVGMPEWGITHAFSGGNEDGSNWGAIYRDVNTDAIVGAALFAQLLVGGKTAWNWPALFDYADRVYWIHENVSISAFNKDLWLARCRLGGPIWTPATPLAGHGWVTVDGTGFRLEASDNLTTGAGGSGGITLTASGGAVTVSSVVASGPTLTGTLSRRIGAGETITYSYTQPGNGLESSRSGADMPSVSGYPVKNYTCQFTINPDGLTGSWRLNSNAIVGADGIAGLSITMSGGAVPLVSAGVSGASINLTFGRQVGSSETGTWRYSPLSKPIQNADGKLGSLSGVTSLLNYSTVGAGSDVTPPTYVSSPSVDTITTTSFIVRAAINEAGTVYWGVYANNATAPTSAQLKSGTGSLVSGSVAAPQNTLVSASVTGRSENTDYDVYVVAEDATPNLQAAPVKIDVLTATTPIDPDVPTWSFDKIKKRRKGYDQ